MTLDAPTWSVHGDSCFGCAGRDVCEAEVTLDEERWCGGATDDRPGLDSDRQSGVELWGARGGGQPQNGSIYHIREVTYLIQKHNHGGMT